MNQATKQQDMTTHKNNKIQATANSIIKQMTTNINTQQIRETKQRQPKNKTRRTTTKQYINKNKHNDKHTQQTKHTEDNNKQKHQQQININKQDSDISNK